MPLQHDRAAPLLHLIGNKIPLFSMSGLKHVYTSIAQWQVMVHNTQSFDKANKKKYNMVWSYGGAIKSHINNEMTVSGNIMNRIF